jgi:alpha-beta hydrolase superfamily lysophospholipase
MELLEKLERAGVGKRPVIWMGHSMGGKVVLKGPEKIQIKIYIVDYVFIQI